MQTPIEEHPLGFFLPENAKILMLGSFPPKKERWSMNFYYPNIQNDMWRIMGLIFYDNKEHFVVTTKENKLDNQCSLTTTKLDKVEVAKSKAVYKFNEQLIREFCIEKGIALGDTAVKVKRLKDNASDKFLEVIEPLDIQNILEQIPQCHTIIVTGEKAMETLLIALSESGISSEAPKVGENTIISFSSEKSIKELTKKVTRQIKLYRMPSSSRAYPKPVEEKAAYYRTALL